MGPCGWVRTEVERFVSIVFGEGRGGGCFEGHDPEPPDTCGCKITIKVVVIPLTFVVN